MKTSVNRFIDGQNNKRLCHHATTHTEEMYEPEIYGKSKPAKLVVVRE
jgi:hypothetical protein